MINEVPRRQFLTGSLAAATGAALAEASLAEESARAQEFYEIRVYRCPSADNQQTVLNYVESALHPALNRTGIDRVGVFTPIDENDRSVYLVIPYKSLGHLAELNGALDADDAYQAAAADFFAIPKKESAYTRIESRLLKAFSGMPILEAPPKDGDDRLLELRIYESHNTQKARLKVEMFNEGEIDIMRDVKLGPVFFGETLISNDVPNLTYMLSAPGPEAHKQHWDGFRKHPDWNRMKKLERYQGTVSKITSVMLKPTEKSEI